MIRPAPRWPLEVAGVVFLATLLTIAVALPVVVHPASRIFGEEIVGRHHDPFTAMARFRARVDWSFETQPFTDYPGAALARALGPVPAYNVMVLASFPLAALFTYLLAREIGVSPGAATLAGLAFAFSTFHLAHAAYHPHVAQVQWIPLYFLALWRCLRRCSPWRGVLLAAAAAAVTLSNFYGGLIAAALTPPLVCAFVAVDREARQNLTGSIVVLGTIVVAGLVYLGLVAPWVVSGSPASLTFPYEAVVEHGALWQAYLLPSVEHPVLGALASRVLLGLGATRSAVEQQVGLGWCLLALAAIGTAFGGRVLGSGYRPVTGVLLVLGLVAWLCSLAPGQHIGVLSLPSPAASLHALLPMFRAFARFAVVVALVVSLLAAIGWSALQTGPKRWQHVLAWVLAMGVCAELWPWPARSRDVLPTEGHRYVADLAGPVHVLDSAPMTPPDVMVPVLMGQDLRFRDGRTPAWRAPGMAGWLRAHAFTHLIVRLATSGPRATEAVRPPEGLTLLRAFPDSLVFQVDLPRSERLTADAR